MRGFILAAGFGTRLRPITDRIPKALVSVAGKPLLERSLTFLNKQGITAIGVNAHYLAEQIEAFRDRSPYPFDFFHERGTIRGTGGGLYFARDFLSGDDYFFVCNVDIVYQFAVRPLLARFLATDWEGALLAVPSLDRATLFYNKDSWLYRGVPADAMPDIGSLSGEYIGAAFYRRAFLERLTREDFSIVPVWKRATERGARIGVLEVDGCYWRDIGAPAALAGVHFDVLDTTVELDVPAHLSVDTGLKRCFHRRLPLSKQPCIGPYAWVETADIPEASRISRSVVYGDATMRRSGKIEQMIITSDGEVCFAE